MRTDGPSQVQGKAAIVTGGTVGIGKAVCLRLVRAGARVVVVGRNEARLARAREELEQVAGGSAMAYRGDVRREADMEGMAAACTEAFGAIDILITSAGILRARGSALKTLQQMTPAEWDEVIDTNLKGVYLANRAVLPAMLAQRGGHIVNLSSTSGRKGYAFDTAYCASKFGVIGLTESLAEEVRSYGIRVHAILPGAVDTPMWDQNGPLHRPEYALPVERVADLLLAVLAMPPDTHLVSPIIEPLGKPVRAGWRGAGDERGLVPSGAGSPSTSEERRLR